MKGIQKHCPPDESASSRGTLRCPASGLAAQKTASGRDSVVVLIHNTESTSCRKVPHRGSAALRDDIANGRNSKALSSRRERKLSKDPTMPGQPPRREKARLGPRQRGVSHPQHRIDKMS